MTFASGPRVELGAKIEAQRTVESDMLKTLINRIPFLRNAALKLLGPWSRRRFKDSASYWEDRYRRGRDSGCGSYNRLAVFKADVLNDFVVEHQIKSIIEFGCGDGHQLSLATYPKYLGLDVAMTATRNCQRRFAEDQTKEFRHYVPEEFDVDAPENRAELGLSLDVLFHLVEDEVFDTYLGHLFGVSERFVVIYSSNREEEQLLPHLRHRKFTDFVATRMPDWQLFKEIPNRYPFVAAQPHNTSKADFFIFAKANS